MGISWAYHGVIMEISWANPLNLKGCLVLCRELSYTFQVVLPGNPQAIVCFNDLPFTGYNIQYFYFPGYYVLLPNESSVWGFVGFFITGIFIILVNPKWHLKFTRFFPFLHIPDNSDFYRQ